MAIYECKICYETRENIRKLSKHIRDSHTEITINEYYDKYNMKRNFCVVCDKKTKFVNLGIGYRLTCFASCAGKFHREKLKKDDLKFEAFTKTVAINQTRIWKTREDRDSVLQKSYNGRLKFLNSLNPEQRLEKFSRYYTCTPEKIKELNEKGRNQCYINWKLGLSGYKNTHKGKYSPKNPHKYKGDYNNIFFRSGWERRLMVDMDTNPNVIEWSSEELIIPYISPKDGLKHRYFPDFVMKVKTMDNKIHTYLLEVKPKKETKPPVPKKKKTKQFLAEQLTFDINTAKWAAAKRFCELHGWRFRIVTEDDLFPKRTKKK